MNNHPVVRIAFLDVGQGDTIVVSLPETKEAVIVDCIDANAVLNYLEQEGVQYLRGLLVTHLHLDHYGGVVQFLDNVERELNLSCERVLFHRPVLSQSLRDSILNDEDGHADGDLDEKTKARKRKSSIVSLLRWAQLHRERYNNLTIQPGITLPLEGVIELIHPWEVDVQDMLSQGLNNTSSVIKVKGINSSTLLTGDIEPFGWAQVDRSRLQSDVLKFPHHGAWKNDDVSQLLDAVKPSVIVISVGTSGIRYSHPNQHVFQAIAELPGVRLMCTQATEQCASQIEKNRFKIVDTFLQQAHRSGGFFIEQRGCPCAGTVILELSESVHIIQPQIDFHQNSIIKPYFDRHQCNLQN